MKKNIEYAFYKGEDFIDLGTLKEIAKRQRIKYSTLKFYHSNSYKIRVRRWKKKNKKGCYFLIPLDNKKGV